MRRVIYNMVIMFLFISNLIFLNKLDGQAANKMENVENYGGFQYEYVSDTDTIKILGYIGKEEIVKVPSEINGKQVESIVYFGNYLYDYQYTNKKVKEIHIPNGVKEIGGFSPCINLEKVYMADSVERICDEAFGNCVNLKSIKMSTNIKEIGDGAFGFCEKLAKINIPYGTSKIKDGAFFACSSLKKVNIPDSVTEIGKEAFGSCKKLTRVKLPNKLKIIEENTFIGCNMRTIHIPENIIQIKDGAFKSTPLKKIVIPSKVKSIGWKTFAKCKNLKSIHIKSQRIKKIEKYAFYKINAKVTFDVPNKCKKKYKKMLIKANSFKEGKMKIK